MEPQQYFQLLKPLYGLCDVGDVWAATMDKHHHKDFFMTPLRSEPALYISSKNGEVNGFSGFYVNDLLRAGTLDFRAHCRKTHAKLDMGEEDMIPCPFTGFYLDKDQDGAIHQHQKSYLKQVEILPPDADFAAFRSMCMKLACLAQMRVDCIFEISQVAQVTYERFST